MKILISGAGGILGGALMREGSKRGYICNAFDRSLISLSLNANTLNELDKKFIGVDYFIHAAANTDVEQCELEPHVCYRDNVLLTEVLVASARRCGVPIAFISSTGVYGSNKNNPWCEYDDPSPTTIHHRSKQLGESIVLAANWSNLVIRTGWLFGGPSNASKNFVVKRILEARSSNSSTIYSNQEQRGCPTNVNDLSSRIFELIELKANGIFNAVNEGSASRFEYVCEILRIVKLDVEVRPISANSFNRNAKVSNNEMAINWRANSYGLPEMRNWQDTLSEYLESKEMKEL